MKYLKIKLPKTIQGYSSKQAAQFLAWQEAISEKEQVEILDMVEIIERIAGVERKDIMNLDKDTFLKVYKKIITDFGSIEYKEPDDVITINGKKYLFNKNFDSKDWTAGRFIDMNDTNFVLKDDPDRLFAICYIEKGKAYGDITATERTKEIQGNFSAPEYINLVRFFLRKYEKIHIGFQILQLARAKYHTDKAERMLLKVG